MKEISRRVRARASRGRGSNDGDDNEGSGSPDDDDAVDNGAARAGTKWGQPTQLRLGMLALMMYGSPHAYPITSYHHN